MKRWITVAIVLAAAGVLGNRYYRYNCCNFKSHDGKEHGYYIYPGTTAGDIVELIKSDYKVYSVRQWNRQAEDKIKPGYYVFPARMGNKALVYRLKLGDETPVHLTFTHAIRTPEQLAGHLGRQLLADSSEIIRRMQDADYMSAYGLTPQTAITLFLPDTYEVYWSMTADQLFERMAKEYRHFWTDERKVQAAAKHLSQSEAATLASIVESETNNQSEYPTIASIYLNRLRLGIPLQACPTVIYAQRDFGKRRVLKKDLEYDSPYNTYKHRGLPPGPIRCSRKSTIDAVLNAPKTGYLYMCANPDFSGTHVFSATLREHQSVAARYQKELNKRHVK